MTNKSRKPWYRPRNILLALLAAFLIWTGSWVQWALTVEPNPSVDHAADLERLSAGAQPAGEDAWPHVFQALRVYEHLETAFPAASAGDLDPSVAGRADATEEAIARVREVDAWLAGEGAYAHLARAAACPRMVRPLKAGNGPLLEMVLPDLAAVRGLARWRIASLHLAFADGRTDDAVAALREAMALARFYTYQPLIIDAMVGHSILSLAWQHLSFELTDRRLEAEVLHQILSVMSCEPCFGDLSLPFEGERRIFLDMVQHVYSDDGEGGGYYLPAEAARYVALGPMSAPAQGRRGPRLTNLLGPFAAGRRTMVTRADEFFDALHELTLLPHDEVDAAARRIETELWSIGRRYALLRLLVPALGRAAAMDDKTLLGLRGTRLLVAIELFRAEHGAYPESLNALVPSILPALEPDPVSGLPFEYRRVEDDPHGRGFLLYSVGIDGQDDGGSLGGTGDRFAALEPNLGVRSDFVLNLPRLVAGAD